MASVNMRLEAGAVRFVGTSCLVVTCSWIILLLSPLESFIGTRLQRFVSVNSAPRKTANME